MGRKKTAREVLQHPRARVHYREDADIVARNYDEGTRIAAVILGVAFGLVFFIGLMWM